MRFRRVALRLLVATLVVIVIALVTSHISARISGADLEAKLVPRGAVTAPTDQRRVGGKEFDMFIPDDRVPRTFADELNAAPLALIPERQANPLPAVAVHTQTMNQLSKVAGDFLTGWEMFAPGDSDELYQTRFAQFAHPDALHRLTSRTDSHEHETVGRCAGGCAGSLPVLATIDPRYYVVARRVDDRTAYITTQMVVQLNGVGSVVSGRSYRRSYALILTRAGGGWVVRRAAAETLNPA